MKFSCIDSFSGAGGLSLGLMRAGFEVAYSFDFDPIAVQTQKANPKYFKHLVECIDITKISSKELLSKARLKKGELSLRAGGPPCQGFSVQRIGEDVDSRNNLVHEFVKKVTETGPRFFLMENVPGINGKRGKQILEEALTFAQKHGYYIHKEILDARNYGVPQRRRRMIVVGEKLTNDEKPMFTFPKPQGKVYTVRQTIGNLPEPPFDGSDHAKIPHHRRDKLSKTNLQRIKALRPGQGREYLPTELLAECHKIDASKIGHRNVYGRMHWDEVAPTITARFDSFTRGQFGHPEQDRTITLREGALLQTFPKDFFFCGNKVDIARQIGNAVPVNLGYAIGKKIIECIKDGF